MPYAPLPPPHCIFGTIETGKTKIYQIFKLFLNMTPYISGTDTFNTWVARKHIL
jgi:hypothetical protein